jgi:hypothetical protein
MTGLAVGDKSSLDAGFADLTGVVTTTKPGGAGAAYAESKVTSGGGLR